MVWFFIIVICKSQSIVPPGLAKVASNLRVDLDLLDALKQVSKAYDIKHFYC